MNLAVATVVALAHSCATSVAPETLVSLVYAESRFDPWAISVNARDVAIPAPQDRDSAAAQARALIARGYNIDLGLGQINSGNLWRLGLSIEDAFDPCRNLAAAARVLASNYLAVARRSVSTEAAIATAFSLYNTGDRWRGFGNGYVGRVYASSSLIVPAIRSGSAVALPARPVSPLAQYPSPVRPRVGAGGGSPWETSAGAQAASLIVFGGSSSTTSKGLTE